MDRFLAGGDLEVVAGPEATALAVTLSRETPAESGDYLDVVQLLGWLYLCRNRLLARGAALPDLRTTARLLAPIHRSAPQTLPTLLLVTVELLAGLSPYRGPEERVGKALNLMNHGTATGDVASVTQAIKLFMDAVSVATIDHPDRAAMLTNACSGWLTVHNLTGDQAAVGHAVRVGEEAVTALASGATHRAETLNNLGVALRLRFDQTGDAGDLDRAIALLTEAVEYTPREDVDWAVRKNNLGVALGIRYEHSGHRPDIDRALVALRQAGEGIKPHRPERPRFLGDLAYYHWVRFQHTGDRADLDAAAESFGAAATSRDAELRQRALAYLEAVEAELAKRPGHGRRDWRWRRS